MSIKNQLKTTILLAVLTAMLLFIGSLFGRVGFYFALIFVGLMNFVSYWFSDRIVLWMYRAKEAKESEHPKLYKIVRSFQIERIADAQGLCDTGKFFKCIRYRPLPKPCGSGSNRRHNQLIG